MPRYIAFLRAINVGGHNVKMPQLVSLFESMGYSNVETFIASGNVIFTAKTAASTSIARKIEKTLRDALGYEVATFVRTDKEIAEIAAVELFNAQERENAHSLLIGMLGDELSDAAMKALPTFNSINEELRAKGREIHFLAHASVAVSKFSNAKFERAIGVPVTFRNINTLVRLVNKYPHGK